LVGHDRFIDDYLKLKPNICAGASKLKKGDKDGLAGWFKIWAGVQLCCYATLSAGGIPSLA
jgi:hypothetical protein